MYKKTPDTIRSGVRETIIKRFNVKYSGLEDIWMY